MNHLEISRQVMFSDPRVRPLLVGDERETLLAFLDWHRRTLVLKCSGLSHEQLSTKAALPSDMTLHGLVRHMAAVERWWFRIQFNGELVDNLYFSDDDPDGDFDNLDGDFEEALAQFRAEIKLSQEIIASASSLDETCVHTVGGEIYSLRRIIVHMLAEYARHNGHADLLREMIDGDTGY